MMSGEKRSCEPSGEEAGGKRQKVEGLESGGGDSPSPDGSHLGATNNGAEPALAYREKMKQILYNHKCGVCFNVIIKPVVISCGHSFCDSCFKRCPHQNCPLCRRPSFNSFSNENLTRLLEGMTKELYSEEEKRERAEIENERSENERQRQAEQGRFQRQSIYAVIRQLPTEINVQNMRHDDRKKLYQEVQAEIERQMGLGVQDQTEESGLAGSLNPALGPEVRTEADEGANEGVEIGLSNTLQQIGTLVEDIRSLITLYFELLIDPVIINIAGADIVDINLRPLELLLRLPPQYVGNEMSFQYIIISRAAAQDGLLARGN